MMFNGTRDPSETMLLPSTSMTTGSSVSIGGNGPVRTYLLLQPIDTSLEHRSIWLAHRTADQERVVVKIADFTCGGEGSSTPVDISSQFGTVVVSSASFEASLRRGVESPTKIRSERSNSSFAPSAAQQVDQTIKSLAKRAKAEAVLLRKVSGCPFIVDLLDSHVTGEAVINVIGYVDGCSLEQQLQDLTDRHNRNYVSTIEAGVIIVQLLMALKHCHERGVIHRDVCLENILLHRSGLLRLADFDRGKYVGTSTTLQAPATPKCVFHNDAGPASLSATACPMKPSFHKNEFGDQEQMMWFRLAIDDQMVAQVTSTASSEQRPFLADISPVVSRSSVGVRDGPRPNARTGNRKVTPYTAPELLTSAGTCTAKSDVWAAGVILYELVTGRKPFSGRTQEELSQSISAGQWSTQGMHPALQAVLRGMLHPDASSRWDADAALRHGFLQHCLHALKKATSWRYHVLPADVAAAMERTIDNVLP